MRITKSQIRINPKHITNLNVGFWSRTTGGFQLWIDMLNKIINPIRSQE